MSYTKEIIETKKINDVLPFVYHDGKIRPLEDGVVSIASNTLQYGIGAIGGIRGYYVDGKVALLELKKHYERLMNASRILEFDYYITFDKFKDMIKEIVNANEITQGTYIRPFIHCDRMIISPCKTDNTKFDMSLYMMNMGKYSQDTLKLKTSTYIKFDDGAISTKAKAIGGYLNQYLASNEAHSAGYDEALTFDRRGYVIEANVANLIISYKGKLYMPPTSSSALEGITQQIAIKLLANKGHKVTQMDIDRSTIYSAEEVMAFGSAFEVSAVTNIDGRNIGKLGEDYSKGGPIFQELKAEFDALVSGKHELSNEMLTYF